MKVVLDTNVLVSGLIGHTGPPAKIVDWLRSGALEPVVDDRMLAEYGDVLRRPYFAKYFSATQRDSLLLYLRQNSAHTVCSLHITGLPDPDDAAFLEVAVTAAAPLVTGNLKHFPTRSRLEAEVLTPTEFVARFARRLGRADGR